MKKPYLNSEQREHIKYDTTLGAFLTLNIALKKFFREVFKPIDEVLKQILLN